MIKMLQEKDKKEQGQYVEKKYLFIRGKPRSLKKMLQNNQIFEGKSCFNLQNIELFKIQHKNGMKKKIGFCKIYFIFGD